MRRSHSESSLFKKQKKNDDKGKEKAKSTAAVSITTTTPVEPAKVTLPIPVWEELLTRIPVLTELLATRVNKQLRDIIEDLIQREYLKPAAELKTILADPENTKDLAIKNDLVEGSAVATFLKVPAARVARLIACDRVGRLYLYKQEMMAPRTQPFEYHGQSFEFDDQPIDRLNQVAHGFTSTNILTIMEVLASRTNSDTSPLTNIQSDFLRSDIVLRKISRGKLNFDTAIHCWRPEEVDRLAIDINSETTKGCLLAGLTPQEITDLQEHNPDLLTKISTSAVEMRLLYNFANIDFATLNALDANSRDFFLDQQTGFAILEMMNTNCNIEYQQVTALSPPKLKAILENGKNLWLLLRFGVPFSEIAILNDVVLKDTCSKAGSIFGRLTRNGIYLDNVRQYSTSPGSLPIIHLDKFLHILDHAENLIRWLDYDLPIEMIAPLDKKSITAMAENNRILQIIHNAAIESRSSLSINPSEVLTILIDKKIPLTELLHLKDNEAKQFIHKLTEKELSKTCDITKSEHIPFSQLAKLPREQLDIVRRDPKTAAAQKILFDLRHPASEEPGVSRTPTRRGSI